MATTLEIAFFTNMNRLGDREELPLYSTNIKSMKKKESRRWL